MAIYGRDGSLLRLSTSLHFRTNFSGRPDGDMDKIRHNITGLDHLLQRTHGACDWGAIFTLPWARGGGVGSQHRCLPSHASPSCAALFARTRQRMTLSSKSVRSFAQKYQGRCSVFLMAPRPSPNAPTARRSSSTGRWRAQLKALLSAAAFDWLCAATMAVHLMPLVFGAFPKSRLWRHLCGYSGARLIASVVLHLALA